ncbi:MAG: GNAT family N-acetyltransferase [Actinomycetota bacterium]
MDGHTGIGAVEADLVAHVSLLHRVRGDEVREAVEAVWFLTGEGEPHANGILRAALSNGEPGRTIDRLLAPFRERRLPMMWWFFPAADGVPPAVDAALRAAGLILRSDLPGMILDLAGYRPPELPEDVTIERVADDATFAVWADVVGHAFDDPSFARSASVGAFRSLGWRDDAPFRHYLARLDGAWAGASTLSVGGGVAGLANIAAVPEARGRGVGTAAAAAALMDATSLGLGVAALSAVPLGRPVYEKLGFRTVGRHLTYQGRP